VSSRRCTVRSSANFRRNLERIRTFLDPAEAPGAFVTLVERLAQETVPALERFPEIGADFLDRAPASADGKALFARVASLLGPGASLRQYVLGDYVILYRLEGRSVDLLAIRHHRELSFDFAGHWP
jgi:plasmid stabilization system protein ParE